MIRASSMPGPGGFSTDAGQDRAWGPLAAGLVYLALALATTWPLGSAPAALLHGNADVYGNAWAIAWVAERGLGDPARLFDANMYFPHTKSLAYAESLLPLALQALPVFALGGSVALAYNLVLLATFPLSGLGAWLLARDAGASRGGAFLAGLGFAFCAYRWDHVVHVQSLSTVGLPMALVFLRRALRGGSALNLLGLAGAAWVQILSSGYYAFLVAVALLAAAAVAVTSHLREREEDRRVLGRRMLGVGLALGAALLAALPLFLQHREVTRRHGYARKASETAPWSAGLRSYADPGAHSLLPHTRLLHALVEDREPLFAGSAVLALAAAGAMSAMGAGRREGARLGLALCAAGFALSLGPEWRVLGQALPGPFLLLRELPGGELLRTPARFGILAILGLDLLAALGWTRLGEGRPWLARRGVAGLAVFMALEAWPSGLGRIVKPAPAPPPSVGWLASAPPGAVLELPWTNLAQGAPYVYWSTGHWKPLVNGYGSFDPPGNLALGHLGRRWPSGYAARVFRSAGVRYVVVHEARLDGEARARLETLTELPPGVSLEFQAGADRVYAIDPSGPRMRDEDPGPRFPAPPGDR
jgi:hypothetical protein